MGLQLCCTAFYFYLFKKSTSIIYGDSNLSHENIKLCRDRDKKRHLMSQKHFKVFLFEFLIDYILSQLHLNHITKLV